MRLRITASRHSAFYSPLLSCVEFLRRQGHEVVYGVLGPGQKSYLLLGNDEVDVMQSAVSSNWNLMDRGIEPLPVHFAQINRRDGFFLVGREADAAFDFRKLEGATLLADHGLQPLVMLKYAVRHNGADWNRIRVVDAGTPEEMAALWVAGTGDYVHLQGPVLAGEIVATVGAAVPPVAFSSLCCARRFQETPAYRMFLTAYGQAREWVRTASPEAVAASEAAFFPQVPGAALADAIRRYQGLACWDDGIEIPRDLYEQALSVFESEGELGTRYNYDEVVKGPF
jgi:ABC-type nitrate/sulfonate/bicarbonate transport system substrate-binding protein